MKVVPLAKLEEGAKPIGGAHVTRRRVLAGTAGLLGLSAVATSVYAAGVEPHGLVVTHYKPRPPAWPAGRKLSITVIADLHAGGPDMTLPHIRQIVETANGLKSDLVVLLGDYANSSSVRGQAGPAFGMGRRDGADPGSAWHLGNPR